MKISNEQSREIYELATNPGNNLTNQEIGKKFDIDEATVRYHIKKWEKKLRIIAKSNDKLAHSLANYAIDVRREAEGIITDIKQSLQEAKDGGVSPEKLAPLYGKWIQGLELVSDLLGKINVEQKIEASWLDEMERSEAAALEEQVLKDPETADLACKLFERVTALQKAPTFSRSNMTSEKES